MNKKKNDVIELERFLACLVIFSYHAGGFFQSGWVFVEFFFLLSGYFTFSHFRKMKESEKADPWYPVRYTLKKFRRLFPVTTIAFILAAVLRCLKYHLTGSSLIKEMLYLPASVFYLAGAGMTTKGTEIAEGVTSGYLIEPTLWYVCAMFAAMPVMLYLLIWFGKKAEPWLVTFFPCFLYGLLITWDGSVNGWHSGHMAFFALDLRALAGLLMGGMVWYAVQRIKSWPLNRFGRILMTLAELFVFACILILASVENFDYDAFMILLFALGLTITLSGKSLTAEIHSSVIEYFGALSFPLYCIHNCCLGTVKKYLPFEGTFSRNLAALCIIAAIAAVLQFIVNKAGPVCGRGVCFLKSKCLDQEV